MSHHHPSLPFPLETAVTIAIVTLLARKNVFLAGTDLDGLYLIYQVFHLSPVCSNILHGRCSHFAGNQREVFSTIPTVTDSILHPIIKHHTSSNPHLDGLGSVADKLDITKGHMQHGSGIIIGEQQIAATSHDKQWQIIVAEPANQLGQLFHVGRLYITATIGPDAKCVRNWICMSNGDVFFHICQDIIFCFK